MLTLAPRDEAKEQESISVFAGHKEPLKAGENRWTPEVPLTLKNKAPLAAAQNNVVRQRSTVHREEPLSLR